MARSVVHWFAGMAMFNGLKCDCSCHEMCLQFLWIRRLSFLGVCGSKIGDFLQFSKIGDFWGFGTQKSEVFGKDLFRRISGRF